MDPAITGLIQTATNVVDAREQALAGMLTFLREMEKIGCGPADQWERIQALQDEAFKNHLS